MGKNNHKGPTQMNLYIRVLAGGYLVYLAYDIFNIMKSKPAGSDFWLMVLFIVLFVAVGVLIVVFSIKSLIKKEYYDPNHEEEEQEPEEIQSSDDEENRQ